MKIDFDGIQAFVLVAELGGFSRAADQLHLTQTALTRRIQKLEAYLAVRLLDRTTRSVQLTAVGRDFLPQARRLVDETTSAVDRLKDMSRLGKGNVAIASIPTMAHHTLPAVIRDLQQGSTRATASASSNRTRPTSRRAVLARPGRIRHHDPARAARRPRRAARAARAVHVLLPGRAPSEREEVRDLERARRGRAHPRERPVRQSGTARLSARQEAVEPERHRTRSSTCRPRSVSSPPVWARRSCRSRRSRTALIREYAGSRS